MARVEGEWGEGGEDGRGRVSKKRRMDIFTASQSRGERI